MHLIEEDGDNVAVVFTLSILSQLHRERYAVLNALLEHYFQFFPSCIFDSFSHHLSFSPVFQFFPSCIH
ncbi:MAG: hypothetical protein N3E41_08570 [Thermofilaceae archaeon]|nr:hypothetical protein [Thermofilaceae archaeon]